MRCRGRPHGWPTHQVATEVTVNRESEQQPEPCAPAQTTLTVGPSPLPAALPSRQADERAADPTCRPAGRRHPYHPEQSHCEDPERDVKHDRPVTPFGESDLRREDVVEQVGVERGDHDGDATQRNGGDGTAATNAGRSGTTTPRTSTGPDSALASPSAGSSLRDAGGARSAGSSSGGPEFIPDSPDGRAEAERLWCAGVR